MISLIIPAYNARRTIGETIESVLAQTLVPDEIIVVDDGSSDGTADHPVLAHSNIRVLRQDNAGAAKALNVGVANASGDYVSFLDADDLWLPEKQKLQLDVLTGRPDLPGVTAHFRSFCCPTSTPAERAGWNVPTEPQIGWVIGTLLLRRQTVDRTGPFPEGVHAGYNIDWLDRMRKAGLEPLLLPDVVMERRIHAGSLSQRSRARDDGYLSVARRALERRRRQQSQK